MVLLDIIRNQPNISLVVAHFNHGIRESSYRDEQLVEAYCKTHGLTFEVGYGKLGPNTSESQARQARMDFLHTTKDKHSADYILTAHHKDDLLETALINIIRGTHRRGMSSLVSSQEFKRPLIAATKPEIYAYAKAHGVAWSEDETNTDTRYLRNYLRAEVIPKMTQAQVDELHASIETNIAANKQIKAMLGAVISDVLIEKHTIARPAFTVLPHDISNEIIRELLDDLEGAVVISRPIIELITHAIKTAKVGARVDISKDWELHIGSKTAKLIKKS